MQARRITAARIEGWFMQWEFRKAKKLYSDFNNI